MGHDLRKELWYKRPAESWIEGFPIGNGRLGAMAECGVNRDHLCLNEESVWAGKPGDCVRTDAREAMKKLQDFLFQETGTEAAADLVNEAIMPEKRWFGSYQVLGELDIRMLQTVEYEAYQRSLDLNTGIVKTLYTAQLGAGKTAQFHKEYFASAPHQVLAVRYLCSGGADFELDITMKREDQARCSPLGNDSLLLEGQCSEGGVRFAGMVKAVPHGGQARVISYRAEAAPILRIMGADVVDIFIAARTDFNSEGYQEQCEQDIRAAAAAGYEEIKREHIREYQRYYSRFEIGFEDSRETELEECSTFERLVALKNGKKDENFYALLVNYYRYLLLSASRPGCLPSNLQGLWNDRLIAPWESDYHTNVNLQINYWPCEGYHLSECHQPLFDWLDKVKETGGQTAENYYGAGGFVLHHASNLFAHTAPCAVPAGLWPLGAAWLVRHLYEHYLYTGDRLFLKARAYPLMKGAAQFLLDFLTEAPPGNIGEGRLVTNPSHSPENKFYTANGTITTFTYGATMDFEIIRDLFGNCLSAITELRREEPAFEQEFAAQLMLTLDRIPPVQISERTGGIQEWIGDYEEVDPGHRHMSHLYGLYPGRNISLNQTPELAAAAKRTLERKLAGQYDGQGWSYGWMSCLWTRLQEPERAYDALVQIVRRHVQHNLFLEAHQNPQVGDGQAIPAAVLEMLVQFDGHCLRLLPALPQAWQNGWVKGLRTIGGYVLDITWKRGRIEQLTVNTEAVFCAYPLVLADGEPVIY